MWQETRPAPRASAKGERRLTSVAGHGELRGNSYAHSDRKSTRLNSSHRCISYAVFCLKKKTRRSLHDALERRERRIRADAEHGSVRLREALEAARAEAPAQRSQARHHREGLLVRGVVA